jgi:translation initiation factor 3 subunit J
LAKAFLKESIDQLKDLLDDDAITEIIKACNVIKNEKVVASKRKVKGQAQKSKKTNKQEEKKAQKIQQELYGENDDFDEYDAIGADYEDDFF